MKYSYIPLVIYFIPMLVGLYFVFLKKDKEEEEEEEPKEEKVKNPYAYRRFLSDEEWDDYNKNYKHLDDER